MFIRLLILTNVKTRLPTSLNPLVFSILPIAFAGLALVYVIETVDKTQYAVRISSDVENLMTSLERVMTYTQFDSEPGYKIERTPPENWPSKGRITLQDLTLTDYPGGPEC